jgi:signal transduction histidine kinase
LVRAAVLNHEAAAARKELKIVTEIAPDLPMVQADEGRIVQATSNLISNAIKFTPSGKQITVALSAAAGGAQVDIRDCGIGISPEDLPKLFAPFGQLHASATRTAGGAGLGLAISKGIVEEHGGWIRADSAPGAGSIFSFWLPGVPKPSASNPVSAFVTERPVSVKHDCERVVTRG